MPKFTVVDPEERCKELIVPVQIDVEPMHMELDNGSSVTIILNNLWVDVFPKSALYRSDVKLRSYSGHEMLVMGEATIRVRYGNQEACLPAVVTAGDGPAIMDRNWLSVF